MHTNTGRPDQLYFLRPDILLQRPADLVGASGAFDFDASDWVLSCPNIRARSKVISGRVRRLLQCFRSGAKISSAILELAKEQQGDPRELLRQFLPILQDLAQWGYLCTEQELPDAAPEATQLPAAAPGYVCQQVLKRSSALLVLRAISGSGETVCVKRLANGDDEIERAKILNEAAVLSMLTGLPVPRIVEFSPATPECALVTSWAGHISAREAFAGGLGPGILIETSRALKLAAVLPRIFTQIHQCGIVHSDLHHHNIRYSRSGACQIIDFGLSFLAESAASNEPLWEAATHFLAPEQFPATKGEIYRRPSFLSEQYSLAALISFLLTGRHYLDFRLEAAEMIEQIRTRQPRPLILRNGEVAPAVEAVLCKALAKGPRQRYGSMAEFAEQFGRAVENAMAPPQGRQARAALAPPLELLRPERAIRCRYEDFGIAGSLNNALAALALAAAHEAPAFLESALIWAGHARRLWERPGLLRAELARSAAEPVPLFVGAFCLHELPVAVDLALATVRAAVGERVTIPERLLMKLEEVVDQDVRWDFTTGQAALLHSLSSIAHFGSTPAGVAAVGDRACNRLLERLEMASNGGPLPGLAMAHGQAGAWYAVLDWWSSQGLAVPEHAVKLFARYCRSLPIHDSERAAAVEASQSISWWCNGLSGVLGLISLAHSPLPAEEKSTLVYAMAEILERREPLVEHICCGKAGQALALIQAFRLTGERRFRKTAASALHRASQNRHANSQASILKGTLGVALVGETMNATTALRVPFFGEL